MLKTLIKMANELDQKGYRAEASTLDILILKNKKALSKLAGEVPAWEAMSHEEHSPAEETPEYSAELHAEEYQGMQMAERLAELVVGGTPVFGLDPDTGRRAEAEMAQELADILSDSKHAETVGAILDFLDGQPPGE